MKALINISIVVVTLLGILGLFISIKGDVASPPVAVSANR